jgi:Tfp pilus assembly protein PilF
VNQAVQTASRLERLVPLLQFDPENLPLYRECVDLAMQGGEYARALGLVDARLTRHPAEAESLFKRSNVLIALNRCGEAVEILRPLEELGVAPASVWENLATCHYVLGNFENARAYSERVVAAGEPSATMLFTALASMHYLGAMDDAAAFIEAHGAAAERNSGFAGACALVYLDREQSEKARKFADLALKQDPDNISGLTVAATLAATELDTDQAFRQYSRILELAPDNGRAHLGLGLLIMMTMDFAKAQEHLRRATELMPTHLGSWHSLAWSHFFVQDLAGAEKYFSHALGIDRTFGESHGAIAAIHAIKGDIASAEREIEIAERLDRRGSSAQFARAMLVARAQGPEASRQFILGAVRAMASQLGGKPRDVLTKLADTKRPS